MHVDDIIAVYMVHDLFFDLLQLTRTVCTRLLGSSAVFYDRTEHGTRLDIIEYIIDLATQCVSISKKNFLNTLYGFLCVDPTAPSACIMGESIRKNLESYVSIRQCSPSFILCKRNVAISM